MNALWGKRLLVVWLVVTQLILLASLLWWYIAFVFATEIGWLFPSFIATYPVCIVFSIFLTWRMLKRRFYKAAFLWSFFPLIWYLILTIILWMS